MEQGEDSKADEQIKTDFTEWRGSWGEILSTSQWSKLKLGL